ncbi:hypothetical protein BU16DRAFT_544128 [Lophium mytilinum]|uniref:Uncharacterized protein n=1 Tax=Lophium mytilinum TaxID=390894 RepID=A0A6A6QBA8_9PEZI|nr:hypothetical protein BU16DRAFT_544128 [Lophium mytilinum]
MPKADSSLGKQQARLSKRAGPYPPRAGKKTVHKPLPEFKFEDSDSEDMFIDGDISSDEDEEGSSVTSTQEATTSPYELQLFYGLPREIRDIVYSFVAEGEAEETVTVGPIENTVRVGLQRDAYHDTASAGYYLGMPKVPALLQTSRQGREEYGPVWAASTEFMLGLASEGGLKTVREWLKTIDPWVNNITKLSFVLRNRNWEDDEADVEQHDMAVYTGWVEYWLDLNPRTLVADGNLIQVVGEKIYYPDDTSKLVQTHVSAFQQLAVGLLEKKADSTLQVKDLEELIEKLLELHGNYIARDKTILRRHFGPW